MTLPKWGKIGVVDVIFGEKRDANRLGALTLEALGLAPDPLKRELKPLPMMLASIRQRPFLILRHPDQRFQEGSTTVSHPSFSEPQYP